MYLHTFLTALIFSCVAEGKPYNLHLYELLPLTGQEPRNGKDCLSASKIVVEEVNNRSDILPDYNLVLVPGDEYADGQMAVLNTLTYKRDFEAKLANETTFYSPIMVAGYQSGGALGLGKFMHHIGMLAFSISAAGAYLTDRNRYPNVYLTRTHTVTLAHAQIQFIRKIGGWKKIAILVYFPNAADFDSAITLQQHAVQNGIQVAQFEGILDFTDPAPLIAIQKNGLRVIIVWTSLLTLGRQFFCLTYQMKMRCDHYIFLSQANLLQDPAILPEDVLPGCKKWMILEQYKCAFATGPQQMPPAKNIPSYFGYDANEFEVRFDRISNKSRDVDYSYRYQCHDATMDAIVALDESQKAMNRVYNGSLTLRNFTNNPQLVMKFTNSSAANLDYFGLRIGRIHYSKITGELETDFTSLVYWGTGSMQVIGEIRQLPNTTGGRNNNDYYVKLFKEIPWMTTNGLAPHDSPQYFQVFEFVSFSAFAVIIALVAASSAFIAVSLTKAMKVARGWDICLQLTWALSSFVLNATAVLFSVNVSTVPNLAMLWQFRIAFLTLGISSVSGNLWARLSSYRDCLSTELQETRRNRSSKRMRTNASFVSATVAVRKVDIEINGRDLAYYGGFILINIAVIIAWLVGDSLACFVNKSGRIVYDLTKDANYEYFYLTCFSSHQVAWQFSLVGLNLLVIAIAAYYAYNLRCIGAHTIISTQYKLTTISLLNAGFILGAGTLILAAIQTPVRQDMAISFIAIILASANSCLLLMSPKKPTAAFNLESTNPSKQSSLVNVTPAATESNGTR